MNVDVISNTVSSREFGRYDDTLKKKSSSRTRIKAFKPKAGSTSVKIQNVDDKALDRNGNVVAGWREVDPSTVQVRGTGYSSWKKNKVSSPGDLYRCVKADVFESQRRYPFMASRVKLPKVIFDDENDHQAKGWASPDLFVISVALPTDPNNKNESNGPGYTVTMYYAMQQETRDILRRITSKDYDSSLEKNLMTGARSMLFVY